VKRELKVVERVGGSGERARGGGESQRWWRESQSDGERVEAERLIMLHSFISIAKWNI